MEYVELVGDIKLDEIKFLEAMNAKQADEIDHLLSEIAFLRELNMKLLEKFRVRSSITLHPSAESFDAISGYVSTKNKVEELEKNSREKYEKENADQK